MRSRTKELRDYDTVQLTHPLTIILGFNADDYKSYQAFKNAYYNAIDSIDKQ